MKIYTNRFLHSMLLLSFGVFFSSTFVMVAATGVELRFRLPQVSTPTLTVPERVVIIAQNPGVEYYAGIVIVKTKSAQYPQKNARSFQSVSWAQTFSSLQVISISAPYQTAAQPQPEEIAFGLTRIFEVRIDPSIDAFEACKAIAQNPDVEYATPVFKRSVYLQPNDPQLLNQYAMAKIQAQSAWDISIGSASVVVADVDSGVDFEHEDLAGNLWTNPGELGVDAQGKDKRSNGKDDDANGYVDDYRGWDFVGSISSSEASAGIYRPDNDPKVRSATMTDQLNHGTATTGCIAAVTANGKGISSIGYQCKYLPIKSGSDQSGQFILRGYDGIRYAANMGAHIINCSWGGKGSSPAEQDLINYATSKGSLVIAASGNDSKNIDLGGQYPAGYDNVLVVGSTDQADKASSFSNYGQRVDVWAPGSSILSTKSNNQYGAVDGTSFACPIVAGIAALVRSVHPEWTPRMIMHQLRSTCDNVIVSNQSIRRLYYGRVNAFRALNENRSLATGTTPGLELSSMRFAGKPAVSSIGAVPSVFSIRNYLGRADNVTITIQPKTSVVTLSQTVFNVASIAASDSVDLKCNVTVQSPTYFTQNSVECLVTMTAGAYTNFQNITIQIDIQTENAYTNYASTPALSFTGVFAKSPVTFWAVGRTSGAKNIFMRGTTIDSSLTDELMCVHASSTQAANIGTGSARTLRTTNGGKNWTPVSTTGISARIYSLNFFDASNGIFVGSPSGSSWNVGTSTDGGQSWSKAASIAIPQVGEVSQNSAIAWFGDYGWVGTSKGRVLRTTDRGASWNYAVINANAVVTQVTFANEKLGFAVLRATGSVNEPATLYRSVDGGVNWDVTGYTFAASGPHPVFAYAPVNSSQVAFCCSLSEVMISTDSGKSCVPLITENGLSATAGFGLTTGTSLVTLYLLGKTIGILKFPLVNGSATGVLSTPENVDFDTLELATSQTKSVQLENTGGAILSVNSSSISPEAGTDASEFILSGNVNQLSAGESSNLSVKFAPNAVGKRSAILNITSTGGNKSVALVGYGKKTSSSVDVEVEDPIVNMRISPNPSTDVALIRIVKQTATLTDIRIFSTSGRLISTVFNGFLPSGQSDVEFSTAALESGSYVCELRSGNNRKTLNFIVQH